jgi:nitrite reductase (NADH) small subunit
VDDWFEVGAVEDVRRARKRVVDVGGTPVVLFWHDGQVYALQNICIHKQRELVKGVILKDRIICPGHQWAFNLETGYEEKMCRYQPTFDVRIEDGVVYVARGPRPVPQEADPPVEQPVTALPDPSR